MPWPSVARGRPRPTTPTLTQTPWTRRTCATATTSSRAALSGGQPSATAKKVLEWISGATPIDVADANNTNYISTVASLGDVPQCAMKVQLDKDGGNFSPFTPPVSCNCFFDKAVTKATAAPAGCVACTSDSQCSGGKRCQTGYCE